jgi:hypothetical protein
MIVKNKPIIVDFLDRDNKAWWAHVTVTPEVNKKKVFVNGIVYVFKILIALGGQTLPILKTGAILEWKKPQKKAKKNIISDIINKTMPSFKPFWTIIVCWLSNKASRITSRHQT